VHTIFSATAAVRVSMPPWHALSLHNSAMFYCLYDLILSYGSYDVRHYEFRTTLVLMPCRTLTQAGRHSHSQFSGEISGLPNVWKFVGITQGNISSDFSALYVFLALLLVLYKCIGHIN